MSFANIVRASRERLGLTQEELAIKLDVSRPAVGSWESGKAKPRLDKLTQLAELLNVKVSDLIDGDAVPLPHGAILPTPSTPAYAPLLGRVHAGDAQEPDVLDDEIPLPAEVYENHPSAYFLQVEGQCMSKVYPEGCHILIDPAQDPSNGSIAVVSIDGADYVMRRLYRGANTLVLSPDSWEDGFEDIVVRDGDDHTVEFHGTVVWFQSSKEME